MNSEENTFSDRGTIVLTAAVAVMILWSDFGGQVVRYAKAHRYLVSLFVAIALTSIFALLRQRARKNNVYKQSRSAVLAPTDAEACVFAGLSVEGERVHIKESFRRMHTQVVGTTNAGKTESVIIPWAINDIKNGRGFLMVDGKADSDLLDKLYAYAKKYGREKDVRILSLCNVEMSHTFNPLACGSVLEVTERIFSALTFDSEYFKSIQYDALLNCLMLLDNAGIEATPYRVIECLKHGPHMAALAKRCTNADLRTWATDFLSLKREEREQRTSGLVAQLQVFAVGDTAKIFNSEIPQIDMDRVLENAEIVYCQLPALKIPSLGKITGKVILQCVQSAVATRYLNESSSGKFFGIYLDDFTEYLTPGFVTLLNKSRGANVGVTFAHQAQGDLGALGDEVKNAILTNSNLKVFMRTNEPDSAEYFSKVIGTFEIEKTTERQQAGLFGKERTGDGSIRIAEEFKFHPNLFKQELGVGEAVVVLPHSSGSLPIRMKFQMMPNLTKIEIPKIEKELPSGMTAALQTNSEKEAA